MTKESGIGDKVSPASVALPEGGKPGVSDGKLVSSSVRQPGEIGSKNRPTPVAAQWNKSFPLFCEAIELLKKTHKQNYIDQDWIGLDCELQKLVFGRISSRGRKKDYRSKVAYGSDFTMVKAVDRRYMGGPLVPEGSAKVFSSREKAVIAKRVKPQICDVCDRPHSKICWDHDHKTGKFRGWICSDCNVALGFGGDSSERLRKLADYLDAHLSGQTSKASCPTPSEQAGFDLPLSPAPYLAHFGMHPTWVAVRGS